MTRKAELKVDLRPTLFIGAGGTGMEVMMRIRRRILSAVWNKQHPTRVESIADFPVARFLHFDLDNNAVIDEGKSQRTDPWYELVRLTDEERLVEPLDLPQYHESDDSLARFPLIESWMPLRPKKLRSLGIDPSKGAGQIRSVAIDVNAPCRVRATRTLAGCTANPNRDTSCTARSTRSGSSPKRSDVCRRIPRTASSTPAA